MFGGGSGDPFEQMHRQMAEMQQRMMGSMMQDPFFGGSRSAHTGQGFGGHGHQGQAPRQPTVEEVDADHQHVDHEPVVEEPDEAPHVRHDRGRNSRAQAHEQEQQQQQRGHRRDRHNRRSRDHQQQPQQEHHRYQQQPQPWGPPMHGQQLGHFGGFQDPFAGFFGGMGGMPSMRDMVGGMMTPFPNMGGGGGGGSYSYSSTYSSSSGPNGMTYEETRSSRRGPNGVMEEKHTMRDGRSGEEHMRLTRGLGDRQRTLERRRRQGGEEERSETLRGIEHGAAEQFDKQWQEAARAQLGEGEGGAGRERRSGRRNAQAQLGFGDSERWV